MGDDIKEDKKLRKQVLGQDDAMVRKLVESLDKHTATATAAVFTVREHFDLVGSEKRHLAEPLRELAVGLQGLSAAYKSEDPQALEKARQRIRSAAGKVFSADRSAATTVLGTANQLVQGFKLGRNPNLELPDEGPKAGIDRNHDPRFS